MTTRSSVLRLCRPAALLSLAALMVAACATPDEPLRSDLASPVTDVQACAKWYRSLDDAIDDASVRDGEAYPIPGFPYLRVNRFLASFRPQAESGAVTFAAWEARLRHLDQRTRTYELQNLPPNSLARLGVKDWKDAAARSDECGAILLKADAADGARRQALIDRAQVPDDYSDWKRAVGLYPLTRIPFFQFAKGWESDTRKLFKEAAATPERHEIVRYQPPAVTSSARDIAAMLANVKRDPLGIPEFTAGDEELLFTAFAPVVEMETTGDYDRIGSLRWGRRETPAVDISHPTIYRRIAYTRYGNQTLVQVVYLLWVSKRPDSGWFDPLSGNLDGLFFRVTLDPTGRPLVYDTIHPCGCYHMFFPTPLAQPIKAPDPDVEWAFVPETLPAVELPQRIVIRVQTRTHYLMDIHPETASERGGVSYALADDGLLRTLPRPTGPRSIYGPDGIVRGTERGERFATWPLGLDEAGSMREWGRHATALIGRRQFDDADLIERRFALQFTAEAPGRTR
jgi:hypothetical protein